ncbi:MAG: hypothetical protein WA821_24030 [Anaerolineales bacterium]
MLKRAHPKLVISIVLAAFLAILSFTNAPAGTTTKSGVVGGVAVRAEKSIYRYNYSWTTTLGSYASSTIGTIGYTYWTIQEKCLATNKVTFYKRYPGSVRYSAAQYYTAANTTYRSCEGQREVKSTGNHDFKQAKGVWQPLVERLEYKSPSLGLRP